jgi:hypothetical protein
MRLSLALFVLLLSNFAFAVDTHSIFNLPQEPLIVTAIGQKPEKSVLRFYKDIVQYQSSVLTIDQKYLKSSHGIIIKFTGMGGDVNEYGVASQSSMTFCNKAHQLGLFPIIVENPIYFGARDSENKYARFKMIEKFSDINAQVKWYNHIVSQIADIKDREIAGGELLILGRSSGTSNTFEWLHRAYNNEPASALNAARVDAVILSGLVSAEAPYLAEWKKAEDKKNKEYPKMFDIAATFADRKLHDQMTWHDVGLSRTSTDKKLPLLIGVAGAQDYNLVFKNQVQVVRNFSARHPGFSMALIPTNGKHDPVASFDKKIGAGEFIAELLRNLVSDSSPLKADSKGLRVMQLNERFSPSSEALTSCGLAFD